MTKEIALNGQRHATAAADVQGLVEELGLARGTVLVELNGTALRPEEWERTLVPGDVVEMLRIVAGG